MSLAFRTFVVDEPGHQPPARLRRVLSVADVIASTGYSRSSIYRLEKDGKFPRRVKLGEGQHGKVGYWADEVATWQAARGVGAGEGGHRHGC